MKMTKMINFMLVVQAIVSLFFSFSLFFILPHQFSQAIAHYVRIAPIIRNFYCLTLLVTGLIGVYFLYMRHINKGDKHFGLVRLICLFLTVFFGFLIFPLVETLYKTHTGVFYESIRIYRYALMSFSLYLSLLMGMGIFSAIDLLEKISLKKKPIKLVIVFVCAILPTCFLSYQKYYEFEEINLTENLKYEFVGVDGKGNLKVISNNHKLSDVFPSFMSSLTYDVMGNGQLANGQQVAITVNYDRDLAKELNLAVIDEVETIEVSGLRTFYPDFESIPTKIVEEARSAALSYVHQKLLEVLPGKETQVALVDEYYIKEEDGKMDSVHALIELYRINYVHQGKNYYYYRACHINQVHSDALKDLEILEPMIGQETYRSSLCEQGVNDMSETEAKAHLYASLMNQYDYVEEILLNEH